MARRLFTLASAASLVFASLSWLHSRLILESPFRPNL